jgi:hypothetical protein
MNAYEHKRQARIKLNESRADKARRLAEQIEAGARKRADAIPFGQPILVGHHSEKRDRNFRGRIVRDYERASRLRAYAAECEHKAVAAQNNASIFSDDPNAPARLREKLGERQARQQQMKKLNTAWRKSGKAGLLRCGLSDAQADSIVQGIGRAYSWGKLPYPSYSLGNNNDEIRRIKQRLIEADAKALQFDREDTAERRDGVTVPRAYSENRLRLRFSGRPAPELIHALKSHRIRWAPSEGVWQRHLSVTADYAAEQVLA